MRYEAVKHGCAILLCLLFSQASHAQLNVFACEPEWAALVKSLGGNAVKVYSATTAQQDPHHIQARPSLIAKTRQADLLVCTGAELETGWLPLLLQKSGNAAVQVGQIGHFMAADVVTLLEKPLVLDRSLGDIHAAGNPHLHVDPERILIVAHALSSRLEILDAENSSQYQKNLQDFTDHWRQMMTQWQQRTQTLRGKRIAVMHNSWVYLEGWLGLERVVVLEPKPGIAPSSQHLSKVLVQMRSNPVDMIVYADYKNTRSARWLSEKTQVPMVGLPFSPASNENLTQWFERLLASLLETADEY